MLSHLPQGYVRERKVKKTRGKDKLGSALNLAKTGGAVGGGKPGDLF